jgi:hypothetical protein
MHQVPKPNTRQKHLNPEEGDSFKKNTPISLYDKKKRGS